MAENKKKLIGLTGPSGFTTECIEMIEKKLKANFVLLYHNDMNNINDWLREVDGIVLAGGIDIHPTVYEESVPPNSGLSKFDLKRDLKELQIIDYCLANRVPLFGICRGHQLIGVRKGLRFLIDLCGSEQIHHPQRHSITLAKHEPAHKINILAKNVLDLKDTPERKVLQDILGEKNNSVAWVNSFHHQAVLPTSDFDPKNQKSIQEFEKQNDTRIVATTYTGIKNAAYIIEIMMGISTPWLSVQFHPEYDWEVNSASCAVIELFEKILNY